MEHQDETYGNMQEAQRAQYEEVHANATEATEKARQQFLERYEETVAGQKETITGLESNAARKVNEFRQDTSQKTLGLRRASARSVFTALST